MCRLFGLIANKPVDVEFSLEKFKEYARWNPDGWGIGWYENGEAKIFKEGISAVSDESQLPRLSKEVKSKIIIAHVRRATEGHPCKANSHPFRFKNWIFAHNGSLLNKNYFLAKLTSKYKNLEGETDSEVYFRWIIQRIDEEGNIIEGIKKAVNEITRNNDYTGLNFLLSNGKKLYGFRYSSQSTNYYSLYMLRRFPSEIGPIEYLSKETKALIRSKALKGEKAVLICSEKLTKDENWEEIPIGNLIVAHENLLVEEVKII